MKLLFLIMFTSLSVGCQSFSSNSPKIISSADLSLKGGKSHVIEVEVGEKLKALTPEIKLNRKVRFGIEYILISGSVQKRLGGPDLENKRVDIRFISAKGEAVEEGVARMRIQRLRRPTPSKAKFSLKVLYKAEIVKCAIEFE